MANAYGGSNPSLPTLQRHARSCNQAQPRTVAAGPQGSGLIPLDTPSAGNCNRMQGMETPDAMGTPLNPPEPHGVEHPREKGLVPARGKGGKPSR